MVIYTSNLIGLVWIYLDGYIFGAWRKCVLSVSKKVTYPKIFGCSTNHKIRVRAASGHRMLYRLGGYLVVDFRRSVAWEIFLFRSPCGRTVARRRLWPRTAGLSAAVACRPRTQNIPRGRRDWARLASQALWLPKARHTDRILRQTVWNRRQTRYTHTQMVFPDAYKSSTLDLVLVR